jgi:transcriptional regulator with XRE-family HTH domain
MSKGQRLSPLRNIVGHRVKFARLRFKPRLTQDQLSGRLAVEGITLDRVAVAKIEARSRAAFDFEVVALAKVLGVDVRWLLGLNPDAVHRKVRKGRK